MKHIGLDKYAHAVVCGVIAVVAGMIMNAAMGFEFKTANAFVGFLAAMAAGCFKEGYDALSKKGVADLGDLAADAVGAVIGAAMIAVF